MHQPHVSFHPALHLVRFSSLTPCPVQILTAEEFAEMKKQQEKDRKIFSSLIVAAQQKKRKGHDYDNQAKKKQKPEHKASDQPSALDKVALKKAVLYFSAASKLAAFSTEELQQVLALAKSHQHRAE